jgi:exodeoxyribonuclease-3
MNRPPYDEPRLITASCGADGDAIRVSSLYVPNGRALDDPHYLTKLVWLERLRAEVATTGAALLLGDFNVAPADVDIYDPSRWRRRTHASPAERAAIGALLDTGLIDVTRTHLPDPGVYTWWSYRPGQFAANRGLRIDLALASASVAQRVTSVWIDVDERSGHQPSDHAPLVLEVGKPRPACG